MAPLFEHYGVQLWMPEAGGRVNFGAEGDEQLMLALGVQSKREITRTRFRVRTAMAAQARDQGRKHYPHPPCRFGVVCHFVDQTSGCAQNSPLWHALATVAISGKNVPNAASGTGPGIAWPSWR
jgi:hypothetical protein